MDGKVYVYNNSDQELKLTINGGVYLLPEGEDKIIINEDGSASYPKFTPSESIIERSGEPYGNEGKFKSDSDDNCTTELLIETSGQTNGPYQIVLKPSQYAFNRDLQMNVFFTGAVVSYKGKVIWSSVESVN